MKPVTESSLSTPRYDSRAGDCNERVEEGGEYSPEQHTTFAKTEKAGTSSLLDYTSTYCCG